VPSDVPAHGYDFVVVANRLPVDVSLDDDGEPTWTRSPGGLVTALAPVMASTSGAWVGWGGSPDLDLEPFDVDGTELIPVVLSEDDLEKFYEGFSNDTLWPLYHDVIAPPTYHREWWESYVRVNQRFADSAAAVAAQGGTVWVQDYQLQLVPKMLREIRPDLTIGFFNHIPFPAYGIFSQLPWRAQIIEGLLGADVIGFQRAADAGNFSRAVRRLLSYTTRGTAIDVPIDDESEALGSARVSTSKSGSLVRTVHARHFPISIDTQSFEDLARRPDIQARAHEIRAGLGNPKVVMLGVDRLDYTKGIGHRLKAFGELLADGTATVEDVTLVQVASPSRERVAAYQQLRDEVELTVGRINGDYSTISHTAISYLHQGYPREEMVALYLASDVMLVTALRDGMNLVAKEYVASRFDNGGVLVLSEFAGAADELKSALLVNPHDIDGLKEALLEAIDMEKGERTRRMRALRKRVRDYDVARWSTAFLSALTDPNGVPSYVATKWGASDR
jgi:trehalose 6-phosphate synthase